MIGFGLRLAVAAGREAAIRLVIIAAAVALGVGLLLTTLAGVNGVNAQNERYAWLNTGAVPSTAPAAPDPLWWQVSRDYFDAKSMGRVDVAATGPRSPVPPGVPRLPGPGEFYASPALGELLRSTPAAQLGDRFPGRQIGTIGPAALPSPNSLIAIVGHTPAEMSRLPGAIKVNSILPALPLNCRSCQAGIPAAGLDLILAVVAVALLFPVLMFIGTATRLAAASREQRYAAMRLVGATPRQVSLVSAVEAAVSALAGTAIGFGLFYLARDAVATIPFTGEPFFPADLSLGPVAGLSVAIGIPAAAAVAARLALRRVRISPLGVSRRVTPRPPRAYRLIPLALGVAELTYWVGRRPESTDGQIYAFMSSLLVIMVGLLIAGPWLTMAGSRIMARRTRRPAALIAARRLADNPQAGFRAVSGLVLALFVTTVTVGVISTIVADRGTPASGPAARNLTDIFRPEPLPSSTTAPAGLASITGVRGVAVVRTAPDSMRPPAVTGENVARPSWLALCAEIARTPDFGRCAPGAEVAWVYIDLIGLDSQASPVWHTAAISPAGLRRLPVESVVVGTDGSTAAIEQARTALVTAHPQPYPPLTEADWNADNARAFNGWKQLANVVILASLAIAGCSLTVSVAGGLTDRKRPFSMLRLTGVPLGVLRRVVALESAAPLLAAAVVAIGTGLLAAHLFLTAQMDYSLHPPGAAYYVIVVAGLAASLGIIGSTLPLLRRITGPETARNE